jgi:four helix bundle protein
MSDQLKLRTRAFAFECIKLASRLPRRFEIQHINHQLLRSSSSVAANYRAAFRARSKIEFVAKLGVVEEECDEAHFWLELLRDCFAVLGIKAPIETDQRLAKLIREAEELLRIVVASKKTAKGNLDARG